MPYPSGKAFFMAFDGKVASVYRKKHLPDFTRINE